MILLLSQYCTVTIMMLHFQRQAFRSSIQVVTLSQNMHVACLIVLQHCIRYKIKDLVHMQLNCNCNLYHIVKTEWMLYVF